MSLTLDHRWEQALIGAMVDAVSKKQTDGFLGRTAIQKLLYFAKVMEVPMRYSFDIHHYGPFCQDVMSDVEGMLAEEVIEDKASGKKYSNYKPGPHWTELQDQYAEELAKYADYVRAVCDALGDMKPETLELIATLDFSFRWVRASGGKGPWRQQAIEKFKRVKKAKFKDDEIDGWYDSLVDAGLIEA